MSNQTPMGDFSDAEKERQNLEYVEWFEAKKEFDEDAPSLKPTGNLNWDTTKNESKAGNFFYQIFATLIAVGLLIVLLFL